MKHLVTHQIILPFYLSKELVPTTLQLHMGAWDEIVNRAYIRIFPLVFLYQISTKWFSSKYKSSGQHEIVTLVMEGWPTI